MWSLHRESNEVSGLFSHIVLKSHFAHCTQGLGVGGGVTHGRTWSTVKGLTRDEHDHVCKLILRLRTSFL